MQLIIIYAGKFVKFINNTNNSENLKMRKKFRNIKKVPSHLYDDQKGKMKYANIINN